MIDIHVLTHEGTRSDWLDECLKSLQDEPCTVHVVDNAGRSVGEGRATGYALGQHPYVGFVDSDDYVFPGAINAVLRGLARHHAVCTLEIPTFNGRPIYQAPRGGHNMFAARRHEITPLLPHVATIPWLCDKLVVAHLKPHQLNVVGYMWRIHDAQTHRRIDATMMQRERARLPW